MPGMQTSSPETQRLVDEEVRWIVTEAENDALELLTENRHNLDALAEALLRHETLDQDEAYRATHIPVPPRESNLAEPAPA